MTALPYHRIEAAVSGPARVPGYGGFVFNSNGVLWECGNRGILSVQQKRGTEMGQVTCLDCWHADDGPGAPPHCGQCPCCKPKDSPKKDKK